MDLKNYEFKIYSQNGEDDTECKTRLLREQDQWTGLISLANPKIFPEDPQETTELLIQAESPILSKVKEKWSI